MNDQTASAGTDRRGFLKGAGLGAVIAGLLGYAGGRLSQRDMVCLDQPIGAPLNGGSGDPLDYTTSVGAPYTIEVVGGGPWVDVGGLPFDAQICGVRADQTTGCFDHTEVRSAWTAARSPAGRCGDGPGPGWAICRSTPRCSAA